jgi:hypothetical protein
MNREEILAGSTEETMRSLYARHQRASIYHPATIGDIPQEVLRKAFIYLLHGKGDLVASSESCRAWRPVAQELIYYCQSFGEERGIERFLCGIQLRSLVFEMGCVSITRLEIYMEFVGRKEYILLLARFVSPSLSALYLHFGVDEREELFYSSKESYEILEAFFIHCPLINIKEGVNRLKKLNLKWCDGDIQMFVDNTPILDLQSLIIDSNCDFDANELIILAVAMNYKTLKSIDFSSGLDSSESLLRVVESCRDLERLILNVFDDEWKLVSSDIEAFASLPRLKYLDLRLCGLADEAVSTLSRFKQLNHLGIDWREGLIDVLQVIGKGLVSLELRDATAESCLGLYASCPNLQYMKLFGDNLKDEGMLGSLVKGFKKRMKRLGSVNVNYTAIRLGID